MESNLQEKVAAAIAYLRSRNIYKIDQGNKHVYNSSAATDIRATFKRVLNEQRRAR
jgi:hypothetical protein